MSKEYIEREAVIAFLENMAASRYLIQCFENKEKFPSADVEPVVYGEWREEFRSQKSPDGYFYWNTPQKKVYVCSICGREEIKKEPYCNCGTRMDGGNK